MTTRFLLIGDCHLRDGEHFDDIVNCLGFACQLADHREVDAVLIAGDAFEGKSNPTERAELGAVLDNLSITPHGDDRPVLIIKGNHDQPRELSVFCGYALVDAFEIPCLETVHAIGQVERGPAAGVDVLCVPWPDRAYLAANGYTGEAGDQAGSAALAAMLRGMVAARLFPKRPLVILGHLQVLGAQSSSAQPLIGKAIEAVLGDLQDLGAAAVVLGHVHKPQQLAPGVEYIGSLTCCNFGEEDEQKRIGILTVEDDGTASWEWLETPCRRWVTIETVADHHGAIEETCSDGTFSTDSFADANVRYRYTCSEEQQHLFDHADIERRFAAAHTLKIVPVVTSAERVRAPEVAAAHSVEDKLRAWGNATGTEITQSHIEKLSTLESEVAK